MRTAIRDLIELGKLPPETSATAERVREFEEALRSIDPPLTNSEAEALVPLLGDDNCFGLAWSLVHLIETAPGWPIEVCLQSSRSAWVQRLRERATAAT